MAKVIVWLKTPFDLDKTTVVYAVEGELTASNEGGTTIAVNWPRVEDIYIPFSNVAAIGTIKDE